MVVALATIATVVFRRPDQFVRPAVWAESGVVTLPQYLQHGIFALFEPVNGYLILPAKIVDIVAWQLSATHYPELAFALTLVVQIVVLCCIALSPTTLRSPLLCALFTLVVPTDAEVFGVSLYLLWWGTLLLVPVLFWDDSRSRRVWPRVLMLAFGALSSPAVIALLPAFVWRWLHRRNAGETVLLAVTVLCAGVQAFFVFSSDAGPAMGDFGFDDLPTVIQKFFGLPFMVGWSTTETAWTLVMGAMVLAVIVVGTVVAFRSPRVDPTTVVMLAYLVVAAIGLTLSRVPVEIPHPVLAGPRYFFYPYVFLGWLLLQIAVTRQAWLRVVAGALVVIAAVQAVLIGPRHHDDLAWATALMRCAASPSQVAVALPVHTNGTADSAWHVELMPAQCRTLVEGGLIHRLRTG